MNHTVNVDELLKDSELLEKIENVKSAEELTEILRDKGYEVAPEQAEFAIACKNGECELPEEVLDQVAGGHPALIIAAGVLLLITMSATAFALVREFKSWKKKK